MELLHTFCGKVLYFFFYINFDPLSLNLFFKKKLKLYFAKLVINLMS